MVPWLDQDADNEAADGFLDFDLPLGACTAQEIAAALLLRQRDPLTMERVIQDLAAQTEIWHSFFSYPVVPVKPQRDASGVLTCLRDLGQGWTANTLYLLAIDHRAAATLSQLARQWTGAKVTLCTLSQTRRLTGSKDQSRLVMVEWAYPELETSKPEFEAIDALEESPELLVESHPIAECSVQQLVAGLMLATSDPHFHPPSILETLQNHPEWWHSFLLGPRLTGQSPATSPPLRVLQQQLPEFWCNDCLYVWARSDRAAEQLQAASEAWLCDVKIIREQQAARLLHFPQASPIVVMSWD